MQYILNAHEENIFCGSFVTGKGTQIASGKSFLYDMFVIVLIMLCCTESACPKSNDYSAQA